MIDSTKSSLRLPECYPRLDKHVGKGVAMKRSARVLAVLSFALVTAGMLVFQAGAAMAQAEPNATLTITCGPDDNQVTITNEGPGKADNVQPLETHSGSGQDAGVDLDEGESATFSVPGDGTYTAHGHHGNNESNPELENVNSVTCSFGGPGGAGGPGGTASTGFNPLPFAAAGVLLLGLGGLALFSRRRAA
jgi:LPXTG-motif cell wall-anchored protein